MDNFTGFEPRSILASEFFSDLLVISNGAATIKAYDVIITADTSNVGISDYIALIRSEGCVYDYKGEDVFLEGEERFLIGLRNNLKKG